MLISSPLSLQTARVAVDTAKKNAIDYLETFLSEMTDPFQTSIVAYALAVANSNKRNDAFYRLQALQLQSQYTRCLNLIVHVTVTVHKWPFFLSWAGSSASGIKSTNIIYHAAKSIIEQFNTTRNPKNQISDTTQLHM